MRVAEGGRSGVAFVVENEASEVSLESLYGMHLPGVSAFWYRAPSSLRVEACRLRGDQRASRAWSGVVKDEGSFSRQLMVPASLARSSSPRHGTRALECQTSLPDVPCAWKMACVRNSKFNPDPPTTPGHTRGGLVPFVSLFSLLSSLLCSFSCC
jgi:hypothetical protein